jgi:hypothetical protein
VTPFVTRPLDNSRAEQLLNVRVSRVMDMIADWDGVRRVRVPMSSGIFLIRGNEPPIEMSQMEPETEAVLLDLLANYPSLLAGSAIDAANPRRWILVAQEMGVGSEGGGGHDGRSIIFSSIRTPCRRSSRSSEAQTPEFAVRWSVS